MTARVVHCYSWSLDLSQYALGERYHLSFTSVKSINSFLGRVITLMEHGSFLRRMIPPWSKIRSPALS